MELFKIICPEEYKGLSVEIENFSDKMNVNGKSLLVFSVLNVEERKAYEKSKNKYTFVGNTESIKIPDMEVDKFYSLAKEKDLSGSYNLVMKKLKKYCNKIPEAYVYTAHGLLHELGHYKQYLDRDRNVYDYVSWCKIEQKENIAKLNKIMQEIRNRIETSKKHFDVTKRERVKLEANAREYRNIPKEKNADEFAYKNIQEAVNKIQNYL